MPSVALPSLLFCKSSADCPKIDPEVFADVRLTSLLPPNTLDAVGYILGEEDIIARREIFSCLQDTGFRSRMSALKESAEEAGRFDEFYNAARSESERDIIFVSLMKAVLEFYRLASALGGDGVLLSRFNDFFSTQVNMSWFRETSDSLEKTYPLVTSVLYNRICLMTKGENIRVRDKGKRSYLSIISQCAENLGLEKPSRQPTPPAPLSINIIEGIVKAAPDEFAAFSEFRKSRMPFYDRTLLSYISQLGFYLGFVSVFDRVTAAGIPLIFPMISDEKKFMIKDAYDITLLAKDSLKIVPNDVIFTEKEPFFYLTGANGGGKTTYLRAVGVAALMFSIGCPVACEKAEISIPGGIFTHFPRDERFDSSGRFNDEQNRVDRILEKADGRSIVLLNETYSATSEDRAVTLTAALGARLFKTGVFGLYITHQHGISQTKVPYLNVIVDVAANNRRTYKVERRRADKSSYARDILEKYKLTREHLGERFGEV
ncbi:MAG: MutS-related protein [Eubacteriales bacterium]|jgi:DNA mismatch repair protein MutS